MKRLAVIALVVAGLAGCGGGGGDGATTLDVLAAASLTDAFTALGDAFTAAHPDVDVTFNFAGSSALAQQILDGAPVDVFASADEANMAKVAGTITDPEVFARNRLAIVVEPGNPLGIEGLADLEDPGVVLVLCAPEVPCGGYAAKALAKADVAVTPASLEENVRGVVSKVALGEADAGIVYVTDVQAAGDDVEGVDIDIADDPDLEAVYPMGTATDAPDAATDWVEFVLSEDGQRILADYGFRAP